MSIDEARVPMTATKMPVDVKSVYDGFSEEQRARALALRNEILAAAAAHPEIGSLKETLKWGEPSYLPAKANIGSTVRIAPKKETGEIALFFICTSSLMDEFREIYPDTFHYHGNRAVTLKDGIGSVHDELRHIIALALTSKLRKRRYLRLDGRSRFS